MAKQDKLHDVVYGMDITVNDYLEKGAFILEELISLVDRNVDSKKESVLFAAEQGRMLMLSHIAHDYLCHAHHAVQEMISFVSEQESTQEDQKVKWIIERKKAN